MKRCIAGNAVNKRGEPVIFRKEYDPYRKDWGYLAIFPEDEANFGRMACVSFHKDLYDRWSFEPFTEVDTFYLLRQKIVHKNDPIVPELVSALKGMYGGEYRVMERVQYK